jgi:hypothetical protein
MFSLKGTVLVDFLTCTHVQVFSGEAAHESGIFLAARMCLWFARVVLVLLFVLARENFEYAV